MSAMAWRIMSAVCVALYVGLSIFNFCQGDKVLTLAFGVGTLIWLFCLWVGFQFDKNDTI